MGYSYEEMKPKLFTEEGIKMIRETERWIRWINERSLAFTVQDVIKHLSGDTWLMLACFDYLHEQDFIDLVCTEGASQDHVYVRI